MSNITFKLEDRVYYPRLQRYGTVLGVMRTGKHVQYEVKIGQWLWSIPENCLRGVGPKKSKISSK